MLSVLMLSFKRFMLSVVMLNVNQLFSRALPVFHIIKALYVYTKISMPVALRNERSKLCLPLIQRSYYASLLQSK
jgi:hypothetical protein